MAKQIETIAFNFTQGQQAEQNGDYERAYQCYTEAHDASLGCPRLHQQAHQHLWKLNLKIGNYFELATDLFVLGLAPIGIFEMIAFFAKSSVAASNFCKR